MADETEKTPSTAESALLTHLADNLPPPLVVEWASQNAHLFKGFGLKTRNAPHFRSLLRRHLARGEKLSEPTRLILARGSLNIRLVAVLSEEALEYCIEEFCALYGRMNFLSSLAVDRRAFVRELAVKHADLNLEEPSGEARAEAPARLRAKLEPFFDEVRELLSPSHPLDPQTGEEAQRLFAAYDRIAALEEELALGRSSALKGVREKLQASEERGTQLEEELSRSKKALARERETVATLTGELEGARAELAAREELRGKALAEAVAEELSSLMRPWLSRPLLVEEAAGTPRSGDLAALAEAALSRQERADRHQGNRVRLSAERANLAELLKKVDSARREALKPLPELREVSETLKAELRRIDELLGEGGSLPANPLAGELIARLNEASGFEELEALKEGLDGLVKAGLASPSDLTQVYEALHRAATRLVDAHPGALPPAGGFASGGLTFRRALAGTAPFLLLVDGHNVLHLLKRVFEPHYEHGRPGGVARDRLLTLVEGLIGRTKAGRAVVFFDSPQEAVRAHSGRVEVRYSGGGGGDQRADGAMVAWAARQVTERPDALILAVTSDRELRRSLAKFCAAEAHSEEFGQFLVRA